ncbi:hypothetical protein C8J56DRAFT_959468 [Mycena floridula]|nr:hypothetical protein C8J56DRAFT_959468 [Mycena floridula]
MMTLARFMILVYSGMVMAIVASSLLPSNGRKASKDEAIAENSELRMACLTHIGPSLMKQAVRYLRQRQNIPSLGRRSPKLALVTRSNKVRQIRGTEPREVS